MKRISTGFETKKSFQRFSSINILGNQGFGIVEVLIVATIACILASWAAIQAGPIMSGMKANKAMYQTIAQLRRGRNLAIAQRRNIQLQFSDDFRIQLVRNEIPNGTTPIGTSSLENYFRFTQFDDITDDTPDHFGNASKLDFQNAVSMTFQSDGTLVNEAGNPINGTIFLGLPDHSETARAVTILGSTGRIRGYRWTGSEWIP